MVADLFWAEGLDKETTENRDRGTESRGQTAKNRRCNGRARFDSSAARTRSGQAFDPCRPPRRSTVAQEVAKLVWQWSIPIRPLEAAEFRIGLAADAGL